MTEGYDPYSVPAAPVADNPWGQGEALFFPVGLLKLALLSVACLGLYQVYWSYRNWKCVQRLTGETSSAPLRAVFYPVTSYFLFRRIEAQARKHGVSRPFQPGPLAAALLVLTLMWQLPDPYWLLAILAFAPLLPVQAAVNELNAKLAPDVDPNRQLRVWNVVALLVGGLILLLAVVGLIFGEPAGV